MALWLFTVSASGAEAASCATDAAAAALRSQLNEISNHNPITAEVFDARLGEGLRAQQVHDVRTACKSMMIGLLKANNEKSPPERAMIHSWAASFEVRGVGTHVFFSCCVDGAALVD